MTKPHLIILGAGPAGLGAAYQLALKNLAQVTVIEKAHTVGGTAASFNLAGVKVDFGSHRLHPSCDKEIMQDIQSLLGTDLLLRPRHGRIRLSDRWIHFPLKPLDILLHTPIDFSIRVARDVFRKLFLRSNDSGGGGSFADVLKTGLGETICTHFYFPYAKKIWGLPVSELSALQAKRRVSGDSIGKIIHKVFSTFLTHKSKNAGKFFYPKHGFGQICEGYFHAAQKAGATFYLNTQLESINISNARVDSINFWHKNKLTQLHTDYLWSTIPVPDLIQNFSTPRPNNILQSLAHINYRAIMLIYLVIKQEKFSEYDAHYFPERRIPITRLSEPKNYHNSQEPSDTTVLCAELPCSEVEPEWRMSEEELCDLVLCSLEKVGIPIKAPIQAVIVRRLTHAYPIYQLDYDVHWQKIDSWLADFTNLLTFGRLGLFAHDNTHHALYMAYAAVQCLNQRGEFDNSAWQKFRKIFDSHVVED